MTAHPYSITLTDAERKELADILATPGINEKLTRRAHVLKLLDDGLSAPDIVRYLQISRSTVYSISQRFRASNLRGALYDGRRSGTPKRIPAAAFASIESVMKGSAEKARRRRGPMDDDGASDLRPRARTRTGYLLVDKKIAKSTIGNVA